MEKNIEDPKYNIVSVRISDEEREYLDKLSSVTNKSVSELMREALHKLPVLDIPAYPAVNEPHSSSRRRYRSITPAIKYVNQAA